MASLLRRTHHEKKPGRAVLIRTPTKPASRLWSDSEDFQTHLASYLTLPEIARILSLRKDFRRLSFVPSAQCIGRLLNRALQECMQQIDKRTVLWMLGAKETKEVTLVGLRTLHQIVAALPADAPATPNSQIAILAPGL